MCGFVENERILVGKGAFLRARGVAMPDELALVGTPRATAQNRRLGGPGGPGHRILGISDPIKESTPAAIESLHRSGVRIIMATGDNTHNRGGGGRALGIDEIHAGLGPEDKNRPFAS